MKLKKYLGYAKWAAIIAMNTWSWSTIIKYNWKSDDANPSRYIIAQQDSVRNVIANLTPEKLTELRKLYSRTYWQELQQAYRQQERDSLGSNKEEELVWLETEGQISEKLKNPQKAREFYALDSVVVHHDTIQIPDNKKICGFTGGSAMNDIPQVKINFFNYNGENQEMKKLAKYGNKNRFSVLLHEIQHIKVYKFIYQVPLEQRKRGLRVLDELLARVAGNLEEYAEFSKGAKSWDDAYETTIYTGDIEYNIPSDVQVVIDRAINDALNSLSDMESYRKRFIESEGKGFSQEDLDDNPNKTGSYAEAIAKMRSSFKINGKMVDIFSQASDSVRQRAEEYINDRDDDMRLVIFAHDHKIKL